MKIKNMLISKSIEYIFEHINDDISVEDVAGYCNFSKYYFSRMFKAETGMSIYSFIKALKMDQSAVSLKVERNKSITDIGEDYGYSSSNYSSAFSKEYDICPAEFRKSIQHESCDNPFYPHGDKKFKSFEYYDKNISIQNLNDFNVIYERYIGNYGDIKENWTGLIKRYENCFDENTLLIEKSYNDPSISKLDKCVYDLCITVSKETGAENSAVIKGGKFAVYRFEGYICDIFINFQGMFNIWFPRSRYKRDNRYGLGIYRKVDMKNNYVILDLCVPVK